MRRALFGTHKDVPGLNKIGTWTPDQPVFCSDEVRFLGDFVAMVVADTPEHARAAAKLVTIDYTELPGIYTIAEGVNANSYIVRTGRETGDVDACKADPEIVKVRVSKDIQPQDHMCMEPVSAIGYARDGKVTVYACTQAPFEVRRMLAKNLAMDEENIRVVATPLGGGFGKKCDSFLEAPTAVAALCCDKPVKVTLTRQEDMIVTTRRHGYHTDYEIGFSKDGKFRYLESFMFSDGGPYEAESYGTLMTGCLMSGGPYIIPNVRVDARCIRNNNLQGGAFRGYGINHCSRAAWACTIRSTCAKRRSGKRSKNTRGNIRTERRSSAGAWRPDLRILASARGFSLTTARAGSRSTARGSSV